MLKIMTAGPTQVRENVRIARSLPCTNPDLDPEFYDFYMETCGMLSDIVHTNNQALILGGEGMLALEAACASLTEPHDRVLVIDNGIFGKGFADLVRIYGGEPVLYTSDYRNPVDVHDLKKFLENDSDFKYATLVHCDTPSGILNDVETISCLLDEYDIMTVTDSVSGLFGQPINLEHARIDILLGGSQKALSAPPGLCMLWISERAFQAMENRKTPIASFYANLLLFKQNLDQKLFPYTMPISDIKGFRQALDNFMADPNVFERHAKIASACRKAVVAGGLKLYPQSGWSDTVTVIEVPEGITDTQLLDGMQSDYGIMISGCFDILAGKVVRIGHMGENANVNDVAQTLHAMQNTLEKLGAPVACDMAKVFLENM